MYEISVSGGPLGFIRIYEISRGKASGTYVHACSQRAGSSNVVLDASYSISNAVVLAKSLVGGQVPWQSGRQAGKKAAWHAGRQAPWLEGRHARRQAAWQAG